MNGGEYYMRVNATDPTGALNPAGDSLMVARTENSQGLVDTGTLSVYVRPASNAAWSLDLNFSFFTDNTLTMPAPLELQLTSLDIDYSQLYFVSNDSFDVSVLSAATQIVTPASVPAGYTGFTASGDATFSDANYAVASMGTDSSFDVRVGHNNVALFMFEFRSPSEVTGLVPEPSSACLILAGVSMLGLFRRRS